MRPRHASRARPRLGGAARPHRRRARRPARVAVVVTVVLAVVLAAVVAVVVTSGVALLGQPTRAPGPARAEPLVQSVRGQENRPVSSPVTSADRALVGRATAVLRSWDRRRASAYARGDLRGLRGLYVGQAGRRDVRLLASYLARGYRVSGMRMQLLAVEVLAHAAGEWKVRVTDRLAGGTAVGHGRRVRLPEDRAEVRVLRLVRVEGVWRAARVTG